MAKDQEQHVEKGGTAIQAGGDVNITSSGLTYSDAREIALDVFRTNFDKLAGLARDTARHRAEEITDEFFNKLQQNNPAGLERSNDPDFQHAVFTVQKEYARNGDKDLGELLIDLLVDRSKQEQRNIMQIVLNESLQVAPKLTNNHLAVLAAVFLFRYTQNHAVVDHEILGQYFDHHVAPFAKDLVKNQSCYQHLEFTGCGATSVFMPQGLEILLGQNYESLFLTGFDMAEVESRSISISLDSKWVMPCLNEPTRLQLRARTMMQLNKQFEDFAVPEVDQPKIRALFNFRKMSTQGIKERCIEIRPYMADVFDVWNDSTMKQFSLTSVGIAIGHANIQRFTGPFADLSIWIN